MPVKRGHLMAGFTSLLSFRCHDYQGTIRQNTVNQFTRKYPKLKEVDDVLGGAAAWENVDSTEGEENNIKDVC